jgi:plastocyanin
MKKIICSQNGIVKVILVLFTIISITSSCTKSSNIYGTSPNPAGSGSPGTDEVWIQGMSFTPSTITVTAGTTITWTNKDAVAHTVTSTTGIFNSGSIPQGKTYSQLFSTTGSYPYFCSIHTSMAGMVVVN